MLRYVETMCVLVRMDLVCSSVLLAPRLEVLKILGEFLNT